MISELRYTLLADGPSDAALQYVIDWTLGAIPATRDLPLVRQFADPRSLAIKDRSRIRDRVVEACKLFPCGILFLHRDAERTTLQERIQEIENALGGFEMAIATPVVPVRMTEAWLLHDERAIRIAADNPNGTTPLRLPKVRDLESVPDPKTLLDQLLTDASEKTGRRLAQFKRDLHRRRTRVATLIHSFSTITDLPAFAEFRGRTQEAVDQLLART